MKSRVFNFGLRGAGLVGRFLLVFLMARVLTADELGIYGSRVKGCYKRGLLLT